MPDPTITPGSRLAICLLSAGLIGLILIAMTRSEIEPRTLSQDAHHISSDPLWPDMRIDLNAADEAQLDLLPAIGPSLARRIVVNRARFGSFDTIDDLQRVPGIGPRTIEQFRPHVVISETVDSSDNLRRADAKALSTD